MMAMMMMTTMIRMIHDDVDDDDNDDDDDDNAVFITMDLCSCSDRVAGLDLAAAEPQSAPPTASAHTFLSAPRAALKNWEGFTQTSQIVLFLLFTVAGLDLATAEPQSPVTAPPIVPAHTLLSAPRAAHNNWEGTIQIPQNFYYFCYLRLQDWILRQLSQSPAAAPPTVPAHFLLSAPRTAHKNWESSIQIPQIYYFCNLLLQDWILRQLSHSCLPLQPLLPQPILKIGALKIPQIYYFAFFFFYRRTGSCVS
jgi:hypothetical protein